MLGANVVHFSFLQEYIACCVGVPVGVYNQFTNNLHVYENNWNPVEWLQCMEFCGYPTGGSMPLVQDPQQFDRECGQFIEDPDAYVTEPFLKLVAAPMCLAFRHHKERDYLRSMEAMRGVVAQDWRTVGCDWLAKREQMYREKQGANYSDNPTMFRELYQQATRPNQA
jgi:hypothetical protein